MSSNNILFKHTGGIHISNVLSLTERKIFNICLKNSFHQMSTASYFTINISEMLIALGWGNNSDTNLQIKEAFRSLHNAQIEWNIFGKDRSKTWGITSFLSSVEIKKGVVIYEFSNKVRDLFKCPNIYARLNMLVQKKFKSKHALVLWEFLVEIISSSKSNYYVTPYIDIEDLKKLLGVQNAKTYESFRFLNSYIIKPALDEINRLSDIKVNVVFKKHGRKTTQLSFQIERDSSYIETDISSRNLLIETEAEKIEKNNFSDIGISEKSFNILVDIYGLENVNNVINIVKENKKNGNTINSPFAYMSSILNKSKKELFEETEKDEKILNKICTYIKDNDIFMSELENLLNKVGHKLFFNWICPLVFSENKNILTVKCPSNFFKDYIYKDYLSVISTVFIGRRIQLVI